MFVTARASVRASLFAALLAASGASYAAKPLEPFDSFIDKASEDWVRRNPAVATATQYFGGAEQDRFDSQLIATDGVGMPIDPKRRAATLKLLAHIRAELKRYDRASLTPVQRVSADSLDWALADIRKSVDIADTQFEFDQFRGMQVNLINFMTQTHPIRNARDIESYLTRLALVGGIIDQGLTVALMQEKKGILPPKFILQATIDGIDRFMADEPGKNVLVASLAARAEKVKDLPPETLKSDLAAAEATVANSVLPAFKRLRATLVGQLAKATDDAGMWRLPGGDAAYKVRLHAQTTTDMTPEQIHQLGLKEVARIEGEMDKIMRGMGLSEGSVQQRHDALEARLMPPAEPDWRPQLLEKAKGILADAQVRADLIFDIKPKAPVQVLREPPFTERSAAAHYSFPAPDGSRPGTVWLPMPGPTYKMLELRSLIYHEGVPGHHFQIALQQELPEIPKFRQKRVFGGAAAFSEGWGLYAEHLAAEQGWYEGDEQGHLGQLYDELFRARRLVVDTGLHAKRWTRQQAIDFGIPASEVDRYVVMPGQACAYKIGELQILALRDKAKQALGDKFSLKSFHNLLLTTGTVPLPVLAKVVDGYIAANR
jgi:uncharacterized protein (DUF885 family)